MVVLDTNRYCKEFLAQLKGINEKHSLLACSNDVVVTCGDSKNQGILTIYDYHKATRTTVDTSCSSINFLMVASNGNIIGCNSSRVFIIKDGFIEHDRSFPTISYLSISEPNLQSVGTHDPTIEIISGGLVIYLNRYLEVCMTDTEFVSHAARPTCAKSGELSTCHGDRIRVRSVAYSDGNLKLFVGQSLLNYITMDHASRQIEFSSFGQLHGQVVMFAAYENKILVFKTEDLVQTIFHTFSHRIVAFFIFEAKQRLVVHCENSCVYVISSSNEVEVYKFNQKAKCIAMSNRQNEFYILFESGSIQIQSL